MTDFKTLLADVKSDTAKQEVIRSTIAKICYNALLAELGEEYARLLVNEIGLENGKKIAKNTVIVGIPDLTDKDGFNITGVASLSVTAHRWNETTTAKKTTPAITLDDIDEAIAIAENLAKVKAEKAEKEKQAKIKKMQKDFEQREKKKGQ